MTAHWGISELAAQQALLEAVDRTPAPGAAELSAIPRPPLAAASAALVRCEIASASCSEKCKTPMRFVTSIPRVTEPGNVRVFQCQACKKMVFQ